MQTSPNNDLVSIVLTTLNGARYIKVSIDSCLEQTHRNIELIIVDGGSTDGTLEILARYSDPRIRVVHQISNDGKLPGAINLGMNMARGRFITWTQDDSWYEPTAIQTMVQYLQMHEETALVYCDYWDVDEHGKKIRYQPARPPEDMLIADVIAQCFLFRREVYEKVGPQQIKYHPVHEIPWRIKVAHHFKIDPLHKPLMFYTVHQASLTGKIGAWALQYMMAQALFEEGYLNPNEYRQRVARIHIDQAFDEFVIRGNYQAFWMHVLKGVCAAPYHLNNRGLLKLLVMSLLPIRSQFRTRLFCHWHERDVQNQGALQMAHVDLDSLVLDTSQIDKTDAKNTHAVVKAAPFNAEAGGEYSVELQAPDRNVTYTSLSQ